METPRQTAERPHTFLRQIPPMGRSKIIYCLLTNVSYNGAAAGFLLCLGLLAWLVYAFFFGSAPTVYKNTSDYKKCWEKPIHSGLLS